MKLLLFEDHLATSFFPICHTRIVGDLRCGALKLRQRLESCFDEEAAYLIRPELEDLYRDRHEDWMINEMPAGDKLYLNFRLRFTEEAIRQIKSLKPEQVILSKGAIVAIRTQDIIPMPMNPHQIDLSAYQQVKSSATLYTQFSELIHDNPRMITQDFEQFFGDKDNFFETEPGVTILNPYNVWLGEGVVLKPGVIIDASDAPVIIDDDALIMHNAVIVGPAYIGKKSIIKIAAKIYEGCSIGPVCKIGGELEGSIVQAYTNKQHDGFLGHSYLGEWVNLGADTNNSDLKNTYKNVAVYSYSSHKPEDCGTPFMGCVIGDHSKLGINSTINTGAVIGCAANIWGLKLISGFIPDFSWGEADSLVTYRIDDFLQTAETVKSRRKQAMGKSEKELYRLLAKENQET